MTRQTPTVTVLMAVFNGIDFLREAIDSILSQTYRDFEFIVYDDASTDGSREFLESVEDPRLILRANFKNCGLSANLADGIARSQAKYIARMDADDIALPQRLERQVQFLETNPEIGVLGTAVRFFKDDAESSFIATQPARHEDIAIELFFRFTMMHPTIMLRRHILIDAGANYDPEFRYSQDFDLWSRLVSCTRFGNLSEPLLNMRRHTNNVSIAKRPEQQWLSDKVRKRQLKHLGVEPSTAAFEAFCNAARDNPNEDWVSLQALDELVVECVAANDRIHFYDCDQFRRRAGAFFRGTCRTLLIRKKGSGRAYWYARSRCFDDAPVRARLGLAYRTLRAHV